MTHGRTRYDVPRQLWWTLGRSRTGLNVYSFDSETLHVTVEVPVCWTPLSQFKFQQTGFLTPVTPDFSVPHPETPVCPHYNDDDNKNYVSLL